MDALKILVVDDESRMRKLVKDFLTKMNFQVLEAGDGEEAMDIFYKEKDIALLILDVMMPKMDGWEVCREIRKNSKVPIIMLTARGDERDELLGFELGVDEYISKPFSPKILVARVEAILRRTGQSNWQNSFRALVKMPVLPQMQEQCLQLQRIVMFVLPQIQRVRLSVVFLQERKLKRKGRKATG